MRRINGLVSNKILFLTLLAATVALFPAAAPAQPCSVSMQVSHTAAQRLSLSDIDFEHFHGTNLLFTILITNKNPLSVDATLHLTIDINLADRSGRFPGAVELTTTGFQVDANGGSRTITNLDLGSGGDIKTQSFSFDQEAKSRIQENALGSGELPAGSYTFNVNLEVLGCSNPVANDQITIVLGNPSRVELRSPRDGEVTNEFPLFEFYQESDRVVLTVAEKTPDQTREDAIAHKPPMLEVELAGQNSYLYSGGRPLEDGKTYVWTVVSKIRTAGGTDVDVASPIGLFSVSGSPQASVDDALLNQLEEILGSRYHPVFQQIRNGGFKLTGNFALNGSSLTRSELLDLLNQLRELGDSVELTFE